MENIPIHESARPERLQAGLVEALRARRLPGRWLYEGAQQARRWLAYHQAWSPSRMDEGMAGVYAQAFTGAAEAMAAEQMGGGAGGGTGGGLHVVGLGCGGGRKDAALLAAVLRRLGGWAARRLEGAVAGPCGTATALHYFPLDASSELVTEAAEHVAASLPLASGLPVRPPPVSPLPASPLPVSSLPMHPLVADLAAYPDLGDWLALEGEGEKPGTARLFSCLGMTPNFDHAAFPRYVRGLLRPGDGLLISANLSPHGMAADGAGILAQYDNPPAREWYAGALENLGLSHQSYRLEVSARALARQGGIWRVVVEARMLREAVLRAGDSEIALGQGERLEVFFSNRFTREAFSAVLADAGLKVTESWLHAGGEEGVFYCRV